MLFFVPGLAHAQRSTPPSAELLRALMTEARAAVAAAPEQGDGRAARLAELQARIGDIEGARETARVVGHTWVPYARIAIVQRDSGDLAGALVTAKLAPTPTDRAQAVGSLASSAGNLDQALAIARTIAWPKQRVEELKLVAMRVRRDDPPRAQELLREAVQVAQADTSHWGRYFDVELAYEQAGAGDVAGALRVLSDTLQPSTRAERLARIATELQRAPSAPAGETADSLFREALRAADAVTDPARHEAVRARVFWLYGFYADAPSSDVMLAESRSPGERATALAGGLSMRVASDADPAGTLATVTELERGGEHRTATVVLRSLLWSSRFARRVFSHGSSPPLPPVVDTLAARAVANAERVSRPFADSTRLWVVAGLAQRNVQRGREVAGEVGDARLRSSAMLRVALEWLNTDADAALRYAGSIPAPPARDSLYGAAARRLAYARPADALPVARQIGDPSHRGAALASVASALAARGDGPAARAVYAEALPLVDPLARDVARDLLRPLHLLGELPQLREWARMQSTPERRAEASVAVLEAAIR